MKQKILFTKDECRQIIDYIHHFDISRIGNRVDDFSKSGKRYNFWVIEKNSTTNWIFDRLFGWFTESTNMQILMDNIKGGLVHNYKIGDSFPKHIDRVSVFKDRLYNIGIQLNSIDEYEGGDYIIYNNDENIELISKEVGNCYYYGSDVLHEVLPITKGERWSFLNHLNDNVHIISNKTNKLI
jgi:hypothetical protein